MNTIKKPDNQLVQEILTDIASKFIYVPVEQYEKRIELSLQLIGEIIGADRAYIFEYNFNSNVMDNTYEWCNVGVTPEKDHLKDIPITDFLDGWVNEHRKGEYVLINSVQDLDPESNLYQVLTPQNIKSLFTMPIFVDDRCFGFVGFDAVHEQHDWRTIPEPLEILPSLYASLLKQYECNLELEHMRTELEHASHVKTDFLRKVTHELRTPLNGIVNSIYLLEDTLLDDTQREYISMLQYSHDTLYGLVENILNYSTIDNKQLTLHSKDINIELELSKLLKTHKYLARNKKLGLYFDFDSSIPQTLSMDIDKVLQILNNLIQNAIKYTNYGHITVKVEQLHQQTPYSTIRFSVSDTGVGIPRESINHIFDEFYQVGDTMIKHASGTGLGLTIAKELASFLKGTLSVDSIEKQGSTFTFELTSYIPNEEPQAKLPLHSLHLDMTAGQHSNIQSMLQHHMESNITNSLDEISPVSLGKYDIVFVHINDQRTYYNHRFELQQKLSTIGQHIHKILLLDGLSIQQVADHSEIFDRTFELPESFSTIVDYIRKNRILSKSIFKRLSQNHDGKRKKSILVVDDNMINRTAMATLLKRMNFNVTEASQGYEAIELVGKKRFDMILMDIIMPGIDGYETTKRIRNMDIVASSVPIIAVTANDIQSTKQMAFDFGMNGILSKPLNINELDTLLQDYFDTQLSEEQPKEQNDQMVFDQFGFEELYEDQSTRIDIVKAFLDEEGNDIKRIQEAFATKSLDYIYKELHYYKGSFAFLKANKIHRLTQTILDLCQQEMIDEVLVLEQSFMSNYKKLVNELNSYKSLT